MLAWVSNSPDLTDDLLADFRGWCEERHGPAVAERYPRRSDWRHTVETPDEAWAAALRVDLGLFMRGRFARYTQALTALALDEGIEGIPFCINIHGTEGGNGVPFAIGVSQLLETWAGVPGVFAGSDHYLGDMSLGTTTDIHFLNAVMAAVNDADQPLTSLEFEAGTGDYGGGVDQLYDASAVDLKTRLCLAQGNRLVNYYLLAGGINPPLDEPVGDGNDRISFTGERHGTAAPIGPEGQHGLTFDATRDTVRAVRTHAGWLADMDEELDDLAVGFVPDAFATEYHHPDSAVMTEVVDDLAAHRGPGPRKALWRSLLFAGYRFSAVDLQAAARGERDLPPLVALSSGRHLDGAVQRRLVAHVESGGSLLLLGRLPDRDLEARPCTVLADGLGLSAGEVRRDGPHAFPSVVGQGWADVVPETRVGWLQPLETSGSLSAATVLRDVDGRTCGVEVTVGAGRAVVLAAELPSSPTLFAAAAERLGCSPGIRVTTNVPGVVVTSTATPDGDRILHVLNPTGYPAAVEVASETVDLGGLASLRVPARTGHLLALGLTTPWGRVLGATAELTAVGDDSVTFAPGLGDGAGGPGTWVRLELADDHDEVLADGAEVERDGRQVTVRRPGAPAPLHLTFR